MFHNFLKFTLLLVFFQVTANAATLDTSVIANVTKAEIDNAMQLPIQTPPPQKEMMISEKNVQTTGIYGETSKGKEVNIKGSYDQMLPVPIDRRMRTLIYSPNDVYKLKFKVGYNSQIVFPNGESPILQTFGDSRGWTIKLVGNTLYMKPMDPGLQTNMIVTTNKERTYYFDIISTHTEDFEDDDFFYRLSFYYPDIAVDGPILSKYKGKLNSEIGLPSDKRKFANVSNLNFQYSFAGGGVNAKPVKVFDDGKMTYLLFANKNDKIPLIYAVDPDGSEHLLRYTLKDGYVVLDTTEYQFSLRFGSELVCIFNEKFVKIA